MPAGGGGILEGGVYLQPVSWIWIQVKGTQNYLHIWGGSCNESLDPFEIKFCFPIGNYLVFKIILKFNLSWHGFNLLEWMVTSWRTIKVANPDLDMKKKHDIASSTVCFVLCGAAFTGRAPVPHPMAPSHWLYAFCQIIYDKMERNHAIR